MGKRNYILLVDWYTAKQLAMTSIDFELYTGFNKRNFMVMLMSRSFPLRSWISFLLLD